MLPFYILFWIAGRQRRRSRLPRRPEDDARWDHVRRLGLWPAKHSRSVHERPELPLLDQRDHCQVGRASGQDFSPALDGSRSGASAFGAHETWRRWWTWRPWRLRRRRVDHKVSGFIRDATGVVLTSLSVVKTSLNVVKMIVTIKSVGLSFERLKFR